MNRANSNLIFVRTENPDSSEKWFTKLFYRIHGQYKFLFVFIYSYIYSYLSFVPYIIPEISNTAARNNNL